MKPLNWRLTLLLVSFLIAAVFGLRYLDQRKRTPSEAEVRETMRRTLNPSPQEKYEDDEAERQRWNVAHPGAKR